MALEVVQGEKTGFKWAGLGKGSPWAKTSLD